MRMNAMTLTTAAAAVAAMTSMAIAATVSYTDGLTYSQDFDSLPTVGAGNPVNAANPATVAGTKYKFANATTNNVVDFSAAVDSSAPLPTAATVGGLGLSSTMNGWYGASAKAFKFGAHEGSQSTGGVLSLGNLSSDTSISNNRALGLGATNATGITYFGVAISNDTGHALGTISLSFTGELWRRGSDSATPKSLSFGYTVDGANSLNLLTAATSASYHELGALTAVPRDGQTNDEQVDGTLAANQTMINDTALALAEPLQAGQTLWLSWHVTNSNSNGNQFAVDDLSFSAVPEPATLAMVSLVSVALLRRRAK